MLQRDDLDSGHSKQERLQQQMKELGDKLKASEVAQNDLSTQLQNLKLENGGENLALVFSYEAVFLLSTHSRTRLPFDIPFSFEQDRLLRPPSHLNKTEF